MIDWSKVGWNRRELENASQIVIEPRLMNDKILIKVRWMNAEGEEVRRDAHIEVLEMPPLFGEAAEMIKGD